MSINWKHVAYGGATARLRASTGCQTGECECLGKGDTLQNKKEIRCGTNTQHPKTDIVVTVIWVVVVTVIWVVVVTVSRARIVLIVDPRTAAPDALVARLPQVQLPVLESILSE